MTDPFSASQGRGAKQGDRRRDAGLIALVVMICVALATGLMYLGGGFGSQGDRAVPESGESAPTGQVTEVTVSVQGMSFVPDVIEVPAGNRLVVTFLNTGDQRHDLLFANGVGTESLAPGASQTVDVGVIDADTEGWCSLPGHRAMGMTLQVLAQGGAGTVSPHATHQPSPLPVPSMDQLIAEAAAQAPHPAELPPLPDQTVHEYTFVVTEDVQSLSEGVVRPLWTYNGTSPGPALHGRVGDTFKVTLENQGSMGHSIDFHAGVVAPDQPMRTIEPGESLEYEFQAQRSGIWMYHCSTMPMSLHIATGMFGAVIIEPDDLPSVDRSYVLVQSGIYLSTDPAAGSTTPDLLAFNGRPFQYVAHPLQARVGERVRLWVLDAGPNESLAFHVVGTQFDTVWSEGHYDVYRDRSTDGVTQGSTGAQVLPLMAAQGGFVEFVPLEAGTYTFVNHIMSLAEKGAQRKMMVTD